MATLRQQIETNILTVTRFRKLLEQMAETRPGDAPEIIRKAYEYSARNHARQSRAPADPSQVHPLEVAPTLAETTMDATAPAAGLLPDSVSASPATLDA